MLVNDLNDGYQLLRDFLNNVKKNADLVAGGTPNSDDGDGDGDAVGDGHGVGDGTGNGDGDAVGDGHGGSGDGRRD